jgi:hypothetical protein
MSVVSFGAKCDGLVEWRASRFQWGLDALAWLEEGGRSTPGTYHLHWIQGLLFGLQRRQIDRDLLHLAL